ncbi:MAG TPA: 30S ribosomal protein S3 [Nanoarchaeota archaeon]|uniref:30S ribosomal protein S3 n=1 Tax=uncultured organism TaxID=155900 RepID=U3GU90_9ZZZZ|nr:30S ribosomal protein S3 [uncultured organism]AJS12682.1 30S ribosomal protein S3 [uncultured archaeon]HIH14247.1 30S ribosomal protein S3 [Nanoarchaeota archaeon]
MIEREFIKDRMKYVEVKEYIDSQIGKMAGIGKILIEKTPLGEKITIEASRPGIVIGRAGKTISELTQTLKTKYKLENPQIDVKEVVCPQISAAIVARKIASDLERFGPARFKAIGYKAMQDALNAGALGAEIKISGRGVPGQRAMSWRFYGGYMKKCGQIALEGVDFSVAPANLRSGTVGIQVFIMPSTVILPDRVRVKEISAQPAVPIAVQEIKPAEAKKEEVKEKKPRKTAEKKTQIKTDEIKMETQNGNPAN